MIKKNIEKFKGMHRVNKIDFVIVVVTILSLFAVGGYVSPLVIAPLNELETTETRILFSIDKADRILIDDNIEFSTPEEYLVYDGLKIDISPGVYYWKAVGVTDSEVRTLTIQSEVNLELIEGEERDEFSVVNAGNIPLNVEIYNGTDLVDEVRLRVGDDVRGLSNTDDIQPKFEGASI